MKNINLVFGCSGTIGIEFNKVIKEKNTLFYSRKKPNNLKTKSWFYINLDRKTNIFPKEVNKIFFFSSPYYKINNLKKNKFYNELKWLKRITKKIKTKIFIYTSSSSVYLKKNPVGKAKLECEKYLISKKNIDYLQIWRPYNLLGYKNFNLSDHFHNLLIKKFYFEKKNNYSFKGCENDERGYSLVKNFCNTMIRDSKIKKSFICEYGNSNTIKIKDIAKIFANVFYKKFKRKINYNFLSSIPNKNIFKFKRNINQIDTKEDTRKIIRKYFIKKLNLYAK